MIGNMMSSKMKQYLRARKVIDSKLIDIQIALYEGTSFIPSRLIRWLTWGDKTHVAWWMPKGVTIGGSTFYGYDSWYPVGVRRLMVLGTGHKVGTKIKLYTLRVTEQQLYALISFCESQVGKKYSVKGIFEFPPICRLFLWIFSREYMKADPDDLPTWFCSSFVMAGSMVMGLPLLIKDPRRTSPDDIETSPALYYSGGATDFIIMG